VGDTLAQIAWKSFSDLELVWPSWLVDRLLPRNSLICLYGRRGSGKTFLALDLALSVAAGMKTWNGLPVEAGRVAYLLAERPDGLKRRILGWGRHRGLTPAQLHQRLDGEERRFLAAGGMLALNEGPQREHLRRTMEQFGGLSLLVIDPLASFNSGLENDVRDMQRFVAGVREIAEAQKCAVLLVHHAGKAVTSRGGAAGDEAFDRGARGSSALEAAMDTVLALRSSGGHIQLEVTKQREHRALAPFTIDFNAVHDDAGNELGQFPTVLAPIAENKDGRRKTERDCKEEQILDAVRTLSRGPDGWVFIKDIIAATKDTLGLSESSIRAAANQLEGKRLERNKIGGLLHYRLVDYSCAGE